jgi:hypothetical protein
MNDARILTPASRLRWDAQKLRDRSRGLALEAYGLLGGGPEYPRRPIYDRIVRAGDRLDQVAGELEQLADELDPEPRSIDPARGEVDQAYTFGVRIRDTDEIE